MTKTFGPFTVEYMPRYRTIADIKQSNRDAGDHFFDRAAMRFFDSRVESAPYKGPGGVYFITSEQFHGSAGYSEPRKFTIRKFNTSTGDVCTAGEYNKLRTIEDARAMARQLAKGGAQ